MTYRFDWKPMPHEVAVACPGCGKEALFEAARWVWLAQKKFIPFFQRSRQFVYASVRGTYGRAHYAGYFPLMNGRKLPDAKGLPKGFTPEDWGPPKYYAEYDGHRSGAIFCPACGLLRKHNLDWPKDAFYQVIIRGRALWAYNRAHAIEVHKFIAAQDRRIARGASWGRRYNFGLALDVIPKHFTAAKVRNEVTKKLGALLGLE